jgi:glyoxalase family protein
MQLTGFHHVTAVTADASGNHAFYTGILGMRLVKKTVNQDDTSAYHLFFADGLASPGSDLTFFDWPVAPERRGTHAVVMTGLRVAGAASLAWWIERFDQNHIRHGGLTTRDGRLVVTFEDPEGQRLCLIDDGGTGEAHPWEKSPVAAEHQIRGLGGVTLSVPNLAPTDTILRDVLEMRAARVYADPDSGAQIHVYEMGEGGRPDCELHVAVEPDLPPAQQGAGAVHHIAFRTPDLESYNAWAERLRQRRLPSSGPIDRYYFRSLYFREPNGILIEIATDGPGFATDEPLERLGERLSLPPFLEKDRATIERKLKPLL